MKVTSNAGVQVMNRPESMEWLGAAQFKGINKIEVMQEVSSTQVGSVPVFWMFVWFFLFFPIALFMFVVAIFGGYNKTVWIDGSCVITMVDGTRYLLEGNEDFFVRFMKAERDRLILMPI